MTTPEHESPREPRRGRHRRSEAEEDIADVFRNQPDWMDEEFIGRALQHNPEAFAAYLQLFDVSPDSPTVGTEFSNIFYAEYDSLDEAIDDYIDLLGWNDGLSAIQREYGIAPDELQWNRAAIEYRFRDFVDIVYYRNKVYTFHQ